MTDLIPPENEPASPARATSHTTTVPPADERENLRRIAAAHTAASRDVEDLVRRLPATPDPSDIAEYTALLAREEMLRAQRAAAAAAAGIQLPSVGGG